MTDRPAGRVQPPQGQVVQLQNFYFNGFELGISNADCNGFLLLNGQPQVAISMSYTTAKTLAEKLAMTVKTLETVTNKTIMNMDEVQAGLERLNKQGE